MRNLILLFFFSFSPFAAIIMVKMKIFYDNDWDKGFFTFSGLALNVLLMFLWMFCCSDVLISSLGLIDCICLTFLHCEFQICLPVIGTIGVFGNLGAILVLLRQSLWWCWWWRWRRWRFIYNRSCLSVCLSVSKSHYLCIKNLKKSKKKISTKNSQQKRLED